MSDFRIEPYSGVHKDYWRWQVVGPGSIAHFKTYIGAFIYRMTRPKS